jgi:hypothetical protein
MLLCLLLLVSSVLALYPVSLDFLTCQGHGAADLGTLLGGLLIFGVSYIAVVSALSSLLTAEYRVPVTSKQSHPHMIEIRVKQHGIGNARASKQKTTDPSVLPMHPHAEMAPSQTHQIPRNQVAPNVRSNIAELDAPIALIRPCRLPDLPPSQICSGGKKRIVVSLEGFRR